MSSARRVWRVEFDPQAWSTDHAAASAQPRTRGEAWRQQVEASRGIPHEHLRATRAEDDAGLHLPRCVKVRIPDPQGDDPKLSPWGAVLLANVDAAGPHLQYLAFGVRHPPRNGALPSRLSI